MDRILLYKIPERTWSQLERNLVLRKDNLITKDAQLWNERIRNRNAFQIMFLVYTLNFFLIRTASIASRYKIQQLSQPEFEPYLFSISATP